MGVESDVDLRAFLTNYDVSPVPVEYLKHQPSRPFSGFVRSGREEIVATMEAGCGAPRRHIRVPSRFRFSTGGPDLSARRLDLQVSLRPQFSQPQRVSVVLQRWNRRRGQSRVAPRMGRHGRNRCRAQARKAHEPAGLRLRLPSCTIFWWASIFRMGCCSIRTAH